MNSKLRNAGDTDTFKAPGSKRESAPSIFVVMVLLVLLIFSPLLPTPGSSAANRMLAAPGDLVQSFGMGGIGKTDYAGGHDAANAVTVNRLGKIIAAGSAAVPGKGTDFALACYEKNGNLDLTFGQGGKATVDFFGANDGARGVAIQDDQKIVLSGFATNGSERQFAIVRFNPDGTLDPTFDQDGKAVWDLGSTSEAFKLALQADDKIVAVGDSRPQNSLDFTAVRLNPLNGSLDSTFGDNGVVRVDLGFTDRAIDLAIDENNIFVTGIVVKTATDSDFGIARLNISNGSLNNAFDGDGKLTVDFFGKQDGAQTIELRAPISPVTEPHLIVGGFATPLASTTTDFALIAVNHQGSLINSLFNQGKEMVDFNGSTDQVFRVFSQPDGDIVAAGWAGSGANFDLGMTKWNADGRLNTGFGQQGKYTLDTASGGNNVAFDAMLYEDTIITAGTGLNPATGNDDFILTQHENEQFAKIIKRAPATPVLRGDTIIYTFEITNLTDQAMILIVNDILPSGATFLPSQNPEWNIPSPFNIKLVERTLSLTGGQTSFIALRVRADQSGIFKNEATLMQTGYTLYRGFVATKLLSSSKVESEVKEIEGDVNGDGVLSALDSSWALGIAANLVDVQPGNQFQVEVQPGNQFQNADTAPRSTKGDGKLDLKDAVQTGRYVGNIDTKTSAGGPTVPTSGSSQFNPVQTTTWSGNVASQTRTLRALNASFVAGQTNTLDIELDAVGGENAAAFSMNFDPTALSFVSADVGSATTGATIVVNSTQAASGRLGVVLALPAGQGLQVGARRIATLRFNVAAGSSANTTPVSFSDQIVERQVVNINADALTATTTNAIVTIARTVATVSAASFSGTALASESIVSAFGLSLATQVEVANVVPLPTTLAGTTVRVRDGIGVERAAPLFFVAPGQINFLIPPGTAGGAATITVTGGNGAISTGSVNIVQVAPGLFTAQSNGQGVAAAFALRVKADGRQITEPVAVFDPAQNRFVAAPIDLGPDLGAATDQVFLVLFGTGWRFFSALPAVTCVIGGVNSEVLFAGPQGSFVGLDQMNVRLPRSLIGRGEIDLTVMVDGKPSNTVKISIK